MIRQLPIIPTVLVLAAVVTMVWLGFWQLGRAAEKDALIEQYSASSAVAQEAEFPLTGPGEDLWFRRSSIDCEQVLSIKTIAGTSARGQKGWAQRATCATSASAEVTVDIGFSRDLIDVEWEGGPVSGIIAPGPRLVASTPVSGLEPLAEPDPNDLPNNHMAYVGQWFFFALTALVIYWLAVRARIAKRD